MFNGLVTQMRHVAMLAVIAVVCAGCFDLTLGGQDTVPAADADAGERSVDSEADGGNGDRRSTPARDESARKTPDDPEDAAPSDEQVEVLPTGSGPEAEIRARHYGPTRAACPSGATRVSPGQSIPQAIERAGKGGTVCVTSGRHRLRSALHPRTGSVLHFEQGAVLDGSKRIDRWTREGAFWVARNQKQSFKHGSVPCTNRPVACEREDLFRDGKPLQRVLRRDALRSGRFYFDEGADTMFVADDPSGHRMESPVTRNAIEAIGARDVTVRGATIEKFAGNGIEGAPGWTIVNNEIRYVHSHGLRVARNTRVKRNYIHHAGTMGIFGLGDRMKFINNHLSHNNYLGLDNWHAGATKIWGSRDVVVRGNWSHHNKGDGWWFDTDNSGALIEDNLFERNKRFGIFYETSFDAMVRRNVFKRNGQAATGDGAGMYINTSKNVTIRNNVFKRNANGLVFVSTDRGVSSQFGRYTTAGLLVERNQFVHNHGFTGVDHGKRSVYSTSANNRFTGNSYRVSDQDGKWWRWSTTGADRHYDYSWSEWRAAGNDRDGSLRSD